MDAASVSQDNDNTTAHARITDAPSQWQYACKLEDKTECNEYACGDKPTAAAFQCAAPLVTRAPNGHVVLHFASACHMLAHGVVCGLRCERAQFLRPLEIFLMRHDRAFAEERDPLLAQQQHESEKIEHETGDRQPRLENAVHAKCSLAVAARRGLLAAEVGQSQKRLEIHACGFEGINGAVLPVDDRDDANDRCAGCVDRFRSLDCRAADKLVMAGLAPVQQPDLYQDSVRW